MTDAARAFAIQSAVNRAISEFSAQGIPQLFFLNDAHNDFICASELNIQLADSFFAVEDFSDFINQFR